MLWLPGINVDGLQGGSGSRTCPIRLHRVTRKAMTQGTKSQKLDRLNYD